MAKMELAFSKQLPHSRASSTSAEKLSITSLAEAQSSCLQIATKLLRLPRELRDMIYIQLFNEYPPPFYNMIRPISEPQWPVKCTGPPCNCLRLHPHYIDLNFMGRQVAREVLEVFKPIAAGYHYEYNILHFEVEDFVTEDAYHVGITREELFRGMDLNIEFWSVLYDKEVEWLENKDKLDAGIASTLNFLMEIACKQPQSITFDIGCASLDEHPINLSYVLKAISPAFHRLREKGFSMRLRYKHPALMIEWEFGVAVWDWSAEEWLSNLRQLEDSDVGFTRVRNSVSLLLSLYKFEV
jgi:hypothetical protein